METVFIISRKQSIDKFVNVIMRDSPTFEVCSIKILMEAGKFFYTKC